MIVIQNWETKFVSDLNLLPTSNKYDVTFTCGDKYDERDDWVDNYISGISKEVARVSYNADDVSLIIDSLVLGVRELQTYKVPTGKILVDATSLALPELVHLFSILKESKRSFDVIYVQPNGYKEKDGASIDKVTSYDLSDDGIGIQQLPPFVGFTSNSAIFICLGFEGHRVGALIHSDEYNTENATCLIGTPAFKIGWENRTLSNNYQQVSELNNNMNANFRFAGANDPLKTYEAIELFHNSLKYQKLSMCLAPFGTKPATIAAAQFAVNNAGVMVAYDFVRKKKRRSEGTDLFHTWTFNYVANSHVANVSL